jgi:hypothetical protein
VTCHAQPLMLSTSAPLPRTPWLMAVPALALAQVWHRGRGLCDAGAGVEEERRVAARPLPCPQAGGAAAPGGQRVSSRLHQVPGPPVEGMLPPQRRERSQGGGGSTADALVCPCGELRQWVPITRAAAHQELGCWQRGCSSGSGIMAAFDSQPCGRCGGQGSGAAVVWRGWASLRWGYLGQGW